MVFENRFIEPDYDFETKGFWVDNKKFKTYSEYNYFSSNPVVSKIKRFHFEKALKLTEKYFNKANVIDFGCADGCFLPTLSNYFPQVLGVDIDPDYIEISQNLINKMNLKNCQCICSQGMKIEELMSNIDGSFDVLFLLEVLEHIGDKNKLYESKIDFLCEISSLVNEDGIIIISVPNMVGLSFLLQRFGLSILGMYKEELSWKELFYAGFLNRTDDLEKKWRFESHIGFNHKKLEHCLKKKFHILNKNNIFFQTVYVIRK
ncbi:MAG: class I SAM-dependent methyltransferase [Methanobacterium sp.]|nr:class I SAM-dependent methyltransferase [Methanobacterium sp.]